MKKLFPLFIALLTFSALSAQSAKDIVQNYLETIGGADQWQNIKTMTTEASMSMQGMSFDAIIYAKYPDKQRVEVDLNGMQLIQAYDGTTAWWINPMMGSDKAQKMPEPMAQSMSNQEFESPFINYEEKGSTVELLGESELEGTDVYELRLGRSDGRSEIYYFDKKTNLPIKMATKSSEGQMIETLFSDYKATDSGLVSPHKMEVKVGGSTQQEITFHKITFDKSLEDAFFAFPN
ncbi:LolA family protein [Flavilitoribacter nigricans]|uniref:Uncharacterized protein TP-0789 domain-containing protein n=1 Tax=Flavilitoribacter nigricans (strain ATCC 23147 / DSM 23189 / NBRC 102662 / NCIMB 1420 / SS-2) TaxID=1122177 RepID=A0A2D0NDP1_FLAN2|nr:outer membrane lipoprotein-sorting protein [Flavilitoribacter nigricans]PHN06634.1 hypothetical protein CRP01_10075 [Flavilitoribacter nigricans DSM 23189 = NBRC 102662]